MRVHNSITVHAGTGQDNAYIARTDKTDSAANGERKTIFAGDMQKDSGLPGLQDRIRQKKEKAQKQALRIVSRAWDNDRKVDEELDRRRQHVLDMRQASKDAQDSLEDIWKQKELVKQEYNIADDSQEQQDLEFFTKVKKYIALARLTDEYDLTSEERDRVDEMFGGEEGFGYTEYQRRQLQLAGQAVENEEIILKNQKDIKREQDILGHARLTAEERNSMYQHIQEMERQNTAATDALKDIEKQSGEIRKEYGIEDGSQEQQDLDFYIKAKKYLALASLTDEYDLDPEENDRLEGMLAGKGGFEYTEYQSSQLRLVGDEIENEKIILQNRKDIIEENYIIRGIKEERRKVHPIIDAKDKAETIMEAAGKDIIGMVVDEAKERLDQEQEERRDEAEEVKEKKEEQTEILDKRKEEREEMEELAEELLSGQSVDLTKIQGSQRNEMEDIANKAEEVALEVQKLFDNMDLLVEDIKGTMVDINL